MTKKHALLVGTMVVSLSSMGCGAIEIASCCLNCATGLILRADPGIAQQMPEQSPTYLKNIKASKSSKATSVNY